MAFAKEHLIDTHVQQSWQADLTRYRAAAADAQHLRFRAKTSKTSWNPVNRDDTVDHDGDDDDGCISPRSPGRKRATLLTLGSRARDVSMLQQQVHLSAPITASQKQVHLFRCV
jgi:hypothetical protein